MAISYGGGWVVLQGGEVPQVTLSNIYGDTSMVVDMYAAKRIYQELRIMLNEQGLIRQ